MYTVENCPFHCNTKDDPHCCPDCAANADYTDCVHLDGIGLCGCAACVAYNRECPFENIRPVRCEWFEVRRTQPATLEQVAADYGLTPDGVSFALEQYQKVICEITHSRMSKLSYYADDILRVADEVQCNGCEYVEPILLTLLDVKAESCPIWLERKDISCEVAIHQRTACSLYEFSIMGTEEMPSLLESEYGKTWRCWNIKPSDEQRKNTPWKE